MTQQQIVLLALQLIGSLGIVLYLLNAMLQAREEKHKYRLYALRDRLISLVADGKLSEKNLLFKTFYEALVTSIGLTSKLTVYGLIQASLAAKNAIQKQKDDRLQDAIDHAEPAVRSFVNDFASVMMDIMMKNSTALRVTLLVLHHSGKFFRSLRIMKRSIVPSRGREIYESYRYFERMQSAAH